MRSLCLASLLLLPLFAACTDDDDKPGADLAAVSDQGIGDLPGDQQAGPDLAECQYGTFLGLGEVDNEQTFACTCGCLIDGLQGSFISGTWSVITSLNGTATAMGASGVELAATSTGDVEFAGLSSLPGINPFYLDGDFEISLDYELDTVSPDARVRLITQTQGGPPTGTFLVERVRNTDGVDRFAGLTGEVAAVAVETDQTSGTLTLRRLGATFTAYADGQLIGQLSGGSVARLHIIANAGMRSCGVDGGTCEVKARIKNLRLQFGTLINKR